MVDPFDSLQTLAEIGIGVAGFSGVVTALQPREIRETSLGQLRLALVLTTSLGAVVGAAFPASLSLLGVGEPALWHLASLVFGILHLVAILFAVRRRWALEPEELARLRVGGARWYSWVTFAVGWTTLALVVANAVPGLVSNPAGVYYLVLLMTIGLSCVFFYRAVFAKY